ncbi:hypothetical protein ACT3OH_16140 [Vreelandella zhanjiangensis]|uniref:hypothetical protein n=1 Tax=Vreelandella zhanjiangensis TaxID=1121960 RepID=UPI00402A8C86
MKLKITTHIIGNNESNNRSLMLDKEVGTVRAFGDLEAVVMEGAHQGRVIKAFAWFEAGDKSQIIITEATTGRCLERIQARAVINGKHCGAENLPDEVLWRMVPSFMEAAKQAGFYRFDQADDETASVMFNHLDELPKISDNGSLVA